MQVGQEFIPYRLFTGAFIPNVILENKNLSATAKLVYGRLNEYAGKNGKCYPSQETLAEKLGCSEKAVGTAINDLVTEGFIKKIEPTGDERLKHYSCSYKFLWHQTFDANEDLTKEGKQIVRMGVDVKTTAPEKTILPPNNKRKDVISNGSSLRKEDRYPQEASLKNDSSKEMNDLSNIVPTGGSTGCASTMRPPVDVSEKTETFVEKVFRYNKQFCIQFNLAQPSNGTFDLSGLETLIDYWKIKHFDELSNPSKVTRDKLQKMMDVYAANGGET